MKPSHLLLCFAGLLAGCNGIFPTAREADRLFVLRAPDIEKSSAPQIAQTLEITLPQAASGLDSARIALLKNHNEMDYYAGARWADSLPNMTQSLLVESFEHQGSLKTVGNDVIGLTPTLRLVVELRDFETVYPADLKAAPDIRVRMVAKLFREPGHHLLTSQSYDETAHAKSNQLAAIISGFDSAFGKAATALVSDVSANAARR